MSKNFSKFDENINLLNLRDSMNPHVKETLKTKAKNYTKAHHNKIVQRQ